MPLVPHPLRLLAAALAVVSLQCSAAPFAVELGGTRIGLDAPSGFADTGFLASPRLQDVAESLTSPSNRVLLFALSDGDLQRFSRGDPPELKRFMIVSTPKEFEREGVTASAFRRLSADLLRDAGAPAGDANYFAFLDNHPPGKARALAELAKQPGLTSLLMGTRLPSMKRDEKPQYLLSTSSLLLVRGKALHLAVYASHESAADIEWIRTATARWIDELKRLNAR
jgi:hypothetical protein